MGLASKPVSNDLTFYIQLWTRLILFGLVWPPTRSKNFSERTTRVNESIDSRSLIFMQCISYWRITWIEAWQALPHTTTLERMVSFNEDVAQRVRSLIIHTSTVAEYLRAKYVEVPVKFLERGRIWENCLTFQSVFIPVFFQFLQSKKVPWRFDNATRVNFRLHYRLLLIERCASRKCLQD